MYETVTPVGFEISRRLVETDPTHVGLIWRCEVPSCTTHLV